MFERDGHSSQESPSSHWDHNRINVLTKMVHLFNDLKCCCTLTSQDLWIVKTENTDSIKYYTDVYTNNNSLALRPDLPKRRLGSGAVPSTFWSS